MQPEMVFAVVVAGSWLFGPALVARLVSKLYEWLFETGEFRRVIWWSHRMKWLSDDLEDAEVYALQFLGLTRTALRRPPLFRRGPQKYSVINARVNLMVTAGRYREAIALAELPVTSNDIPADLGALINVNVAEALYNLGRWDEASRRLVMLENDCDPLAYAGLLNQRCWIMAHTGRAQEALPIHETIIRNALPPIFRAEHHFTAAAIFLGLGRFDRAVDEAALGQALSLRASSKRNAVFLLGRIQLAIGDVPAAEALFCKGSHHRYQGQGGDGLLAWGDCLSTLGRVSEAHEAWKLCAKRDPQSAAAAQAKERLVTKAIGQSGAFEQSPAPN